MFGISPKKTRSLSLKALLALILYLIIPVGCLLLILESYPELPQERFITRIYWVIPTASAIVLLAQLSASCQKGDTKRYLLSIGFTAATLIWMFGLLGGGAIITTHWNEYEFSLHMHNYILLIVSVAALNMLYYTLEWRVYREEQKNTSQKQANGREFAT